MSKREAEPTEGNEVKKQHVIDKGIAPIKAEFIVHNATVVTSYNDDEAEGGDRDQEESNNGGKGKKKRGQNKKRDLKQSVGALRLCSTMLDPDNIKVCNFGPSKCKNTHDIETYLASKPEDIDGMCPVYEAIGYCPTGLKCRWLGSHYNKETKKLVKDLERFAIATKDNIEVNKITADKKNLLQRKKYQFEVSDKLLPWLDGMVQTDAKIAKAEATVAEARAEAAVEAATAAADSTDKPPTEETVSVADAVKEMLTTFVEAPVRLAEKKRLFMDRAKIVSPLTTVGNLPYRRLMKTLGADVTYSEMALCAPLIQGTNPEWALPKAHKSEYPGFGVQIATSKHWAATKSAEVIYNETSHVSELNLNCGCPIDLLYRQGQGSALMDQPARLIRILKGMNYASGDIPVTVKIRTGTKESKNTANQLVARMMAEGDVASITLHGRSRQQRYAREADWDYIGKVGQTVAEWNHKKLDDKEKTDTQPTWFIGNGDVYTHEDWYKAVNTPGIDSVMVARGALIKPWIFEEVESQQYLDKTSTERLEMLGQYAKFAIEHWGSDEYGVGLARRFMCEFISFTHRYIPVGILERLPPRINQRPPQWKGRDEMETLLGSGDFKDWIKITEMFLGKAGDAFQFTPKHKSNS